MKRTKIMSLLLAFVMLFSLAMPTYAANFSDVPESYHYYEAIQDLVARGVINGYEDGTFKPDATITRAEFCKMVIHSIGLGSLADTKVGSTGFPDVSPEHWAAGAIKTAFDMKIINGFEDGTFRADQNVTYDQAIKMVVCAKYDKFGEVAMKNGGFPVGYRKVATSYGFLKNIVDGVYDQAAKRGTVAKLMFNMVGIKLSDVADEDTPLVEAEQKIKIEGQVIAVPGVTMEGGMSTLTSNQIKIDVEDEGEVIFSIKSLSNKDEVGSLLGKLVVGYYTEESGVKTQALTSLTEQRGCNDELVIDLNAITSFNDNTVSYENEDGDTKKIKMSSSAVVMYNGSMTEDSLEDVVAENEDNMGSIRFLMTEGEGELADVIFVSVYKNYQVSSVSSSTKTVTLNDGTETSRLVLDEEDSHKSISITKKGSAATFSSIAKNQILSIAIDETGNIIQVMISADTVTGTVNSITTGEETISVNSKSYAFADAETRQEDLVVGAYVKLYLDAFGKIAKYELQAAQANYTYAYLTQIQKISSGLTSNAYAQLIDLNTTSLREFKEYALADKVKVNGVSYTISSDYDELRTLLENQAAEYVLGDYGAPDGAVHQPIKYSRSADGKINNIIIGKENPTNADLRVNMQENIKCTTQNTGLANIYKLNSTTKVLFVPQDDDDLEDTSKYAIKSGTASGLSLGTTYDLLLVDVSSAGVPAIVIMYKDMSSQGGIAASEWVNFLPEVVVSKGTDESGNRYIAVWSDNSSASNIKKYYDEDNQYYSSVDKGDIVRVAADDQKNINALEIVVEGDEFYTDTTETVFVRVGAHNATNTEVSYVGKSGGYAKVVREGGSHDIEAAAMSLMTGRIYSAAEVSNLWIALDYDFEIDGDPWTVTALGEAGLTNRMSASGVKVLCVTVDSSGTFKDIDEITYSDLYAYTDDPMNATSGSDDADKVFVYRNYNQAKLIVVYRELNNQ
ncbi:MAG: S-layer homology domain-containing protein [Ruminococcaceae bacterium]|nr:S-layer homology domain-containing protein [Oscillospiraceae bacterium]